MVRCGDTVHPVKTRASRTGHIPAVRSKDTDEGEAFSEVFRALSEPLRMDIVRQITQVDELPWTTLEQTLPISKSTISYHIKILSQAGLIQVRREGRYYFYRLREDVFEHLLPGFLSRLTRDHARA